MPTVLAAATTLLFSTAAVRSETVEPQIIDDDNASFITVLPGLR